MAYGESPSSAERDELLFSVARGGNSSLSIDVGEVWIARGLGIDLDRARGSERRVVGGLGSNAEEFVRDDVEATEAAWVKIEYVADLEGPTLRPRCC